MKALPPAQPQLELLPRFGHALSAVEPSARKEILRTLAEILLAAVEGKEARDEAN